MKKRKAAAWLLTGAMAVTMCAPAAVQAEGVEGIDNTLLAEFDFNTPASDGVLNGTGAKAKVNGNIQLQDRIDGDTALYLDGSSGTSLDVTAENGSSLLTGRMQVSRLITMNIISQDILQVIPASALSATTIPVPGLRP